MQHLLSIIVPVYKVEDCLERCVESILKQTYTNFECILVDDGSPDACGEICDRFAEKDYRIKVIHQENEGLSGARNNALKIVKGDLLAFVDSDDYLEPNMYEKMIASLDDNSADIVMCMYKSEKGSALDTYQGPLIFTGYEFTEKVLMDQFGSQLWKFIYKTKLWDGVISPYRRHAQDMMILHIVTNRAEKVIFLNEPLYCYNDVRETNISNSKKNIVKNKLDRALAFFGRADFCQEFSYSDAVRKNVISNAILFMVNGFFNDSVFEKRYQDDIETLRKYTKKYSKDIKSADIRKDYVIRSNMIRFSPKLYIFLYVLFSKFKRN